MGQMLHVPTLPHSLFDDSPLSGAAFDFTSISQSQEALADPFSGTVLDGYELGEPIGSGGCARVYRAKQTSSGRLAAIKIGWEPVRATSYSDQHMHFCEVNALRRLSGLACPGLSASPHVFHDGLILGRSLDIMSSPEILLPRRPIFIGLLSALEAVHKAGIAHRDIKPSNFTFGPEGPDFQKIHVIDFGFAAALPRTNNEYPASFCGTPDYASWNLMMGTHPHGARDDVESLIYTLLDFYLRGCPWDVALPLQNGMWSREQVESMAAAREAAWQEQCKLGRVPACLKDMLTYARSLQPVAMPDYSFLRILVLELPDEAPVSVAAYLQAEE